MAEDFDLFLRLEVAGARRQPLLIEGHEARPLLDLRELSAGLRCGIRHLDSWCLSLAA